MIDRAYTIGPTLDEGERPWPIRWESNPQIDDGHLHEWENVLVRHRGGRIEEAVRCAVCHAPRCGSSRDDDPCVLRRHHPTAHLSASGRIEPIGGR